MNTHKAVVGHQRLERFRYQGMEKRFALQRLQSARQAARQVPGFGQRTTVMILASISPGLLEAPMPRRKKANKIQAQCGCDPKLRQSGKDTGSFKLSKRGSS